jgi:hypothetical protein
VFGAADLPVNIRLWRHVEQAVVMRLYADHLPDAYGSPLRAEAHWRWLIGRHAHDRMYVAIEGPDKLDLDQTLNQISGYAVMREGRILEMMTANPRAETELLIRACHDACELDLHHVRFDAPPHHALHQVFVEAGGERFYHEADSGEVFLIKLFEPVGWLLQLGEMLQLRARQARLSLPCELAWRMGEKRYCLSIRQQAVHIREGKLTPRHLVCSPAEFVQMVLGHIDVRAAFDGGRFAGSHPSAIETASILFPKLPLWFSVWDDLPVG